MNSAPSDGGALSLFGAPLVFARRPRQNLFARNLPHAASASAGLACAGEFLGAARFIAKDRAQRLQMNAFQHSGLVRRKHVGADTTFVKN